jgi:hypothetical protein
MRTLRLFLPGSFEDAQLYMGHLVVFTSDGDAQLVELEALTNRLETRYPAWRGLLTLAFARNDWLTGAVMTSLTRNEDFADALNVAAEGLAGTELELGDDDVDLLPLHGFEQEGDVILDTVFYGARLYLGTTSGLFDFDIDWQERTVGRSRQRLDARCVAAAAEYGAVNASCEGEGLFTAYDEFGWRSHSTNGSLALQQTAPRSLRASWFGTDLVNYESQSALELLRASVEEVTPDSDDIPRKRKVVTRFSRPTHDLDALVSDLTVQRGVAREELQFVWNSSRAFFINTYNHGFFTAAKTTTTPSGNRFTHHGATDGRVVAVHRFPPQGWVIETDFRAYLWAGGQLSQLLDKEPMSVRTFEGSKRYRQLIAITVEEGLHLVSVIRSF